MKVSKAIYNTIVGTITGIFMIIPICLLIKSIIQIQQEENSEIKNIISKSNKPKKRTVGQLLFFEFVLCTIASIVITLLGLITLELITSPDDFNSISRSGVHKSIIAVGVLIFISLFISRPLDYN